MEYLTMSDSARGGGNFSTVLRKPADNQRKPNNIKKAANCARDLYLGAAVKALLILRLSPQPLEELSEIIL
jgi:hypothetical protein